VGLVKGGQWDQQQARADIPSAEPYAAAATKFFIECGDAMQGQCLRTGMWARQSLAC
jgi:hypothetical protein